jgi:L-2,4-diaminobutyrate decarboxylase
MCWFAPVQRPLAAETPRMFEARFFGAHPDGLEAFRQAVESTAQMLTSALPDQPYSGTAPAALAALLQTEICPSAGRPLGHVLERARDIVSHSVALWHPNVVAHLQCPVTIPALAAEMVVSALNQSMDSFDQAPAATILEQQVTAWLCQLAGYPETAGGTFTVGGTQSNFMGLLLARDHFLEQRWQWDTAQLGLPPDASRLRVLCSDAAHFSVEKSALQLGLGTQAVQRIDTDEGAIFPDRLARGIATLRRAGFEPFAIVATAGTTDFGAIDPLASIAEIAAGERIWLHVDAAYGAALLMSPQHRDRLDGLAQADSITLDFHKAFFQPISCGAFLLRDAERFRLIRMHADYLNPAEDEETGRPDLVTRSILTTRRFDALKLWVSLQTIGADGFAEMVNRLVVLAQQAATSLAANPRFALLHRPAFSCLVFRYVPANPKVDADAVNVALPRRLFDCGAAVLGHTVDAGRPCLKFTLINPCTEARDIERLIELIESAGLEEEAQNSCQRVAGSSRTT